jgi:hypothetical protein
VAFLPTTGPVAGQFLHRTSRALDPHLHTHVVVANVAQGVDGRWSGVDSRRLHAHLPAAQSVYHARLRFELGDRMGASWHVQPSGLGDVVGVDPTLCRLFSQRAASMDEYRFQRAGSADRTPGAYFADRPEKDRSVTVDELLDRWRERAADLGLDLGDLTRTVGARRVDTEPRIDRDRLRHQLVDLTSHRTVGRQHVVAAVAASIPGGAVGRDVETVTTRLLDACGPAEGPSAGRSPVGRRWEPSALVRAVDGRGFDRLVSTPEGGDRDGRWADRARSGPEIDRAVGLGRSRQVAAPDPLVRSLGLER